MKVTVLGSHLCPDTMYALMKLKEAGADMDFKNISSEFPALKAFLKERETNELYVSVRENGGIGMPFFTLENGTQTFDLELVLKSIQED